MQEETQKSVLCLLPRMFDARISRRVDMLKRAGFKVEILAFERSLDPGRVPDCPTASLGTIRHGRYLTRIVSLLSAVRKVRPVMRRNDVLYAFNTDMAFLAQLSGVGLNKPKPLVQETADILNMQTANVWGAAVRAVDKRITERCKLLVLTSESYCSYYQRWLGIKTPTLVIENKLSAAFVSKVRKTGLPPPDAAPSEDRPLRIGWFGILREPWSLRVLDALTRAAPRKFQVVLAGVFDRPMQKLGIDSASFEQAMNNPNIEYRGPYSAPDDLPDLYSSVDLVMDCYQSTIPFRWSQTNKYYEACLFGKPLIACSGSADAKQIERHDIGLVLSGTDVREAVAQIRGISAEEWLHWHNNMAALPPRVFTLIDEEETLGSKLRAIAACAA